MLANQVKDKLKSKNISVVITSDNKVKLTSTDPASISNANRLLQANATTYSTAWTHMGGNDIYTSEKMIKSTKTAFVAAIAELATGGTAKVIAAATGAGFAGYWFVESDTVDVYYSAIYYYRETGHGRFDSNGNFMGDYQIKKVDRVTKNSDWTGGQTTTTIKNSTILDPWF